MQMVPAGEGGKRARISGGSGGLLSRLNPFAPLQRLAGRLREGQQLSRKVQQRAAALSGEPISSSSSSSSSTTTTTTTSSGSSSTTSSNKSAGEGAAGPAATDSPAPLQYSLQDLPARRLLASGTPPQLAWVPLRVALQLLKSLPQHFVLLANSPPPPQQQQQPEPGQQQAGSKTGKQVLQQQPGAGPAPGSSPFSGGKLGSNFSTVTSPAGLEVHIIPVSGTWWAAWYCKRYGKVRAQLAQPLHARSLTCPARPACPSLPCPALSCAGPGCAAGHPRGRQHRVHTCLHLPQAGRLLHRGCCRSGRGLPVEAASGSAASRAQRRETPQPACHHTSTYLTALPSLLCAAFPYLPLPALPCH